MNALFSPIRTRDLEADSLALAYPLVQARFTGLSLEDWLGDAGRYVEGGDCHSPGRSGVLALETPQRQIVGVFTYRIVMCGRSERVLECNDPVAFNLFRSNQIATKLMRAIRDLAMHKGCRAVRLRFSDADDPLLKPARTAGLLGEKPGSCVPIQSND